jgi:chloride channel protein, CIC family
MSVRDELATDARGVWRMALVAVVAGILTGVVGAAFRVALEVAAAWRDGFVQIAREMGPLGILLPILVVAACAGVARFIVRLVPEAGGSGVHRVEAVMRGEIAPAPLRVVPAKFIGGVLALGSGLVLGREGPTVQMGATIGDALARWTRLSDADLRDVQAAAAGAGLGVAFSAPFGGAMFTFEEVRRAFTVRLAIASLLACAAAQVVASALLGADPDFHVAPLARAGWETVVLCLALGALLGLGGVLYNTLVVGLLNVSERLRAAPAELRAAVVGAVIGTILWLDPLLVGGGDALTQRILDGRLTLEALLVVLVVRVFLGPLSYSAGTPGGLFAPLLLVGAAAGAAFAVACNVVAPGLALDPTAFAIVGMSTFFAAVVRAPFTGLLLIVEMTATTSQVIPMLAAAGAAVAVATALRGEPIYDTLRHRLLAAGTRAEGSG